jgi:sugar lactone lactonase YvrE
VKPELVYFPSSPATARVVHLKSFNRLSELVPTRTTFVDLFRGRSAGSRVLRPNGIVYHDGHLYICDTGLRTVHDWDLATGRARRLGDSGPLTLSLPVAAAVDKAGAVFVADAAGGDVVGFDPATGFGRRYRPSARPGFKPVAVAVGEGRLYVADQDSLRIELFSIGDGSHLAGFDVRDSAGGWALPTGLAIDDAGTLYVADMPAGRIMAFMQDGSLVRSIGQRGNRYGDLGQPKGVAIGPDDVLFVADAEFGHVHIFNADGRLLMLIGGPKDEPGGTPMPVGVAVAPSLPDHLTSLVPRDFAAHYFVFVTDAAGGKRISLFAVGSSR